MESIRNTRKQYDMHFSAVNYKIADSLKTFGGRYGQVEATTGSLLTAVSVQTVSNS